MAIKSERAMAGRKLCKKLSITLGNRFKKLRNLNCLVTVSILLMVPIKAEGMAQNMMAAVTSVKIKKRRIISSHQVMRRQDQITSSGRTPSNRDDICSGR